MADSKFVYWAKGIRHEVPVRPVAIHDRVVFQRVDRCAPFHNEDMIAFYGLCDWWKEKA